MPFFLFIAHHSVVNIYIKWGGVCSSIDKRCHIFFHSHSYEERAKRELNDEEEEVW